MVLTGSRATTTGKAVTLLVVEDAFSVPMLATVPVSGVSTPSTRTEACWPTLILSTTVSAAVVATWYFPGARMVITAVLDAAVTVEPAVMDTAATVPASGLVSVAAARFCCAICTLSWARSMAA